MECLYQCSVVSQRNRHLLPFGSLDKLVCEWLNYIGSFCGYFRSFNMNVIRVRNWESMCSLREWTLQICSGSRRLRPVISRLHIYTHDYWYRTCDYQKLAYSHKVAHSFAFNGHKCIILSICLLFVFSNATYHKTYATEFDRAKCMCKQIST